MNNFWNSNTIVVAFGKVGVPVNQTYSTSDMLTFIPTDPAGTPPTTTPIQKLEFNLPNTTEYMIRRSLLNLAPPFQNGIPAGTQLTIWVEAKFDNGTISGTQTITVPTVPSGVIYDRVSIDIRGQIKDFNADPTVYRIRIY